MGLCAAHSALSGQRVRYVAAGLFHAACVTEDGNVFTWVRASVTVTADVAADDDGGDGHD